MANTRHSCYKIIKDEIYLNPRLYDLPEDLVYVRSVYKDLEKQFERFANGDLPFLFLTGPSGSGKTVALFYFMKKFSKLLEPNQKIIYVRCSSYTSYNQIIRDVASKMSAYFFEPPKSIMEFFDLLRKYRLSLLLILDEVDKIQWDYIGKFLFTLSDERGFGDPRVGFIATTNSRDFVIYVYKKIGGLQRRMDPDVYFPRYRSNELLEILKRRAKWCLKEGTWSDDIIEGIVGIMNRGPFKGNATFALTVFSQFVYACENAGLDRLDLHLFKNVFVEYGSKYLMNKLRYSVQGILILYILSMLEGKNILSFRKVYRSYFVKMCKDLGITPITYRSFLRWLDKFRDDNVFSEHDDGLDKKVITLNLPKDIIKRLFDYIEQDVTA